MRVLIAFWLALGTAVLAQQPPAKPNPAAPSTPATAKPAAPGVTATAGAPVVSEVLAVQVMLDRAGFSPGEIDGQAGANFKRAIEAFQKANGVTVSGTADQATWQKLAEKTGNVPPLTSYETTSADVAGPFTPDIPADLVEQSKLKALGYKNALEAIAEKFHVSPKLLESLNTGKTFSTAGESLMVPNVITEVAPAAPEETVSRGRSTGRQGRGSAVGTTGTGRSERTGPTDSARSGRAGATTSPAAGVTIAVTKATSSLTVEDAQGNVLFHAPVTSGSEHDPLPIGTWKVTSVLKNPVFNYNPDLFWDANPKHSKARIPAGPNNPVGVAWIDLSKEHYGIHGTPEPSRVGHTQSHGCVRLTNWDVQRVMQWARAGTTVVFR